MGIYFQPPPPFMGGAQPHAPRVLPSAITAVPVNNPPFSPDYNQQQFFVGRFTWNAPDPSWIGGDQPFAGRLYFPQGTAGTANNPPFSPDYNQPQYWTIRAAWEPPPPSPYFGAAQALQPKQLSPYISAQHTDNPPFEHEGRIEALTDAIRAWQPPDPLPVQKGKNAPGIPGQSVDNPPLIRARLDDLQATAAWPQTYPPLPILGIKFTAGTAPAAPQTPFVFAQILAGIILGWQPLPPPPTLPRFLPAAITSVPVNNPPFTHAGRLEARATIIQQWQPPPPWAYIGGRGQLMPRPLNPALEAVRVDAPPARRGGQQQLIADIWLHPPYVPPFPLAHRPSGSPTALQGQQAIAALGLIVPTIIVSLTGLHGCAEQGTLYIPTNGKSTTWTPVGDESSTWIALVAPTTPWTKC